MNSKYKYIILDFGKVLAGPATGEWFITPKFLELIDINLIDKKAFNEAIRKYDDIKSRPMVEVEEEYEIFYEFYDLILREINYPGYVSKLAHLIAYNFAYEDDKYTFYPGIENELEELSKKYKLILLTDNWPSVDRILKIKKLDKYFEKVYISSCYASLKKDGVFFNYPIIDFRIKAGDALFIDDSEDNLRVAQSKGLDVLLMDREDEVKNTEFKKIKTLRNL